MENVDEALTFFLQERMPAAYEKTKNKQEERRNVYETDDLSGQCGDYEDEAGSGRGHAAVFYRVLWKSFVSIWIF